MLGWLRRRDPELRAFRRATRAAILMPASFAVASQVIGNSNVATFAAFGSFALLVLADFGGPMHERLLAQFALVAVGCVFITVATLAQFNPYVAALAMLVVGFVTLFAGIVSSVIASATTSVLLGFILPVTTPGGLVSLPDRLFGWLIAGGVSLLAIRFLWPMPEREPLRDAAAAACRQLSERLRAPGSPAPDPDDDAVTRLRTTFYATQYRPTGLTTETRALVRLVDELLWLRIILDATPSGVHPEESVHQVKIAASTLLEHAARCLGTERDPEDSLQQHLDELAAARDRMESAATIALPGATSGEGAGELVTALEPGFRAHELTFAVTAVAGNVEIVLAAYRRSWWAKLLGHQPDGIAGPLAAAQQRAGAHAERHSVWLHNSIRGAIGLAGAVLVADLTGAQHAFWIVLGMLSVLRSNALSTGQNVARGLAGTVVGFAVGGLLVLGIGTTTLALWLLLPVAIVIAGTAPAVSFAAGQAGFTVTLLILFNLIAPVGWQVGLLRIEDVGIGCAISIAVGLLFWPRGASRELGNALREAYRSAAEYLRATAETSAAPNTAPLARSLPAARSDAAAAARRLDDAFRGYLAERGSKHVPLAEASVLVTGVAGLRITADAVYDLWQRAADPSPGSGEPDPAGSAYRELTTATDAVTGWFREFGDALGDVAVDGAVPAPLPRQCGPDGRLVEALRRDIGRADGADGSALAVRLLWTGDHMDAARRLQPQLAEPGRTVVRVRRNEDRLRLRRGHRSADSESDARTSADERGAAPRVTR